MAHRVSADTRGFLALLALLAFLMFGALTGLFGWISEEMTTMEFGDAATWFGGIATAWVAFLAYRTSRDAAKIAHEAHEANLKAEALKVDYFMEMKVYGMPMPDSTETMEQLEPDALELPPRPGQPPWGDDYYEPYVRVILRITNRNDHAISPARILMTENLTGRNEPVEARELSRIRPGDTRFWFKVFSPASSSIGTIWALNSNKYVQWLEFIDSHGVCWRRLPDGSLQRRGDRRI